MDVNDFRIVFPINLEKVAMISIAKTLWTLPSTLASVRKIGPHKLKVSRNAKLPSHMAGNLSKKQYKKWEKVIAEVLKKTTSFNLPPLLEMELRKIIILTGNKMFYFNRVPMDFKWHTLCSEEVHGAKEDCYATFVLETMTTDRLKNEATEHFSCQNTKLSFDFYDFICIRVPDENAVFFHQNEIIEILEAKQSGIEIIIKSKKDIVFNIICVWNYMRKYRKSVREQYLKRNCDYIIPLNKCVNFIGSYSANYFVTKLISLDCAVFYSLSSKILRTLLKHGLLTTTYFPIFLKNKILCSGSQFEDHCQAFLSSLSLFPSSDVLHVFKKYINEVIIFFLPVWPYFELIPQILDFSYKENLNLNHLFLLDCIFYHIINENKSKYRVNRHFYLQLFEKVWHQASEIDILSFFAQKIHYLSKKNFSHPMLIKLTSSDNILMSRIKTDIEVIAINCVTKFTRKEKLEFVINVITDCAALSANEGVHWNFVRFYIENSSNSLENYPKITSWIELFEKLLDKFKT